MGRPWIPHASLAFPCSEKAWEYIFQATSTEAWISMENHGKHGTVFSYDFKRLVGKHGDHSNSFNIFMTSNSMGKHGKHENPFFS